MNEARHNQSPKMYNLLGYFCYDFCSCMTTLFCKSQRTKGSQDIAQVSSHCNFPASLGSSRERAIKNSCALLNPAFWFVNMHAVHQEYQKQYNSLQQSSCSFHSSITNVERKEKKTQFSRCECQSCYCGIVVESRLIVAHTPKDTREKSPACAHFYAFIYVHYVAPPPLLIDPCSTEMEHWSNYVALRG